MYFQVLQFYNRKTFRGKKKKRNKTIASCLAEHLRTLLGFPSYIPVDHWITMSKHKREWINVCRMYPASGGNPFQMAESVEWCLSFLLRPQEGHFFLVHSKIFPQRYKIFLPLQFSTSPVFREVLSGIKIRQRFLEDYFCLFRSRFFIRLVT